MSERVRINPEKLARTGPKKPAPCGECGKKTKSHILVDAGSGWEGLELPDPLGHVGFGVEVRFIAMCHSCFSDMDMENEWTPEHDGSLFSAVKGQ
jgi:hypothetical protein